MKNTIQTIDICIARNICFEIFQSFPISVERFQTGNCHFVYKIIYPDNTYVLRISSVENRGLLQSSLYWIGLLKEYGISIPKIVVDGTHHTYPYVLLAYIEGEDLGGVYGGLSENQKWKIAQKLSIIQKTIGQLPKHRGFGYLTSYEDMGYKNTWKEVIVEHLHRSKSRISLNGIFDPMIIDTVESLLTPYDSYFYSIEPLPFLDDTSTKNVLIHEGQLSGIVDIDTMCFGDRLYVIGLTQMALISQGSDTDYIQYWTRELDITSKEQQVLNLYTLIFCVDFMSEKGMQFNKKEPVKISDEEIFKLKHIFDTLYAKVISQCGCI